MNIGLVEPEYGAQRFWDGLKQRLDEELTQDELKRALYLVDIPRHGINSKFPMLECQDWSNLLIFLENNMLIEDALSMLKHVFAVMDLHLENEDKSLAQIIQDYEHAQQLYGCPNIIGREEEIIDCFDKLKNSDCKGLWIHGVGGLGKTVLANEVCSRFFIANNAGVVNINLKQVKNPCEFVRVILAMFTDSVSPSSDLSILTGELLFRLKEITKDTYIVLDNIEEVYQFNEKEVLQILSRCWNAPAYMPIKWIVTSRIAINLDEAHTAVKEIELFPLKREHATHLLKLSCKPIQLTETQYQIVLDMSGEVPLAIRLLASAIKRYKSDWQCDTISEQHLKPLLKQELHPMNNCIAYAYRSLKEAEQNYLNMLSIVDLSEFDVETVKAILEIEDEKEVILLMMSLTNRHIVQRVHTGRMQYKYSTGLKYCLHPLVLHYLSDLQPDGYNIQTQNNFCRHVLKRIEHYITNIDMHYMEAISAVSSNRSLLKVLFSVLSTRKSDDIHLLTTNRNRDLSKLHGLLNMTQTEKGDFYSRILEQSGNLDTNIFWKLEQITMLTDGDNFVMAKSEIEDIENNAMNYLNDDESSEYLKGRFWYIKGRYCRRKHDKELHIAIECFKRSLHIYEDIQYIPDAAMALNAIGNAYFDQGDYDIALKYHKEASKRLREFIPDNNDPNIIIYDFNIGTIYLAKAQQECSIHRVTDEAIRNLDKALEIFNDTMSKDVKTGTSRMPQYADKLEQRANALFRLNRYSEAISDMKSSLKIKLAPYKSPDSNITAAYFRTGKMFKEWHKHLSKGSVMATQLLKEALICFRYLENEIRTGADLSRTYKSTFISYYREIAKDVQKDERQNIYAFCTHYERGASFNPSDSSSSSSSSSPSSMDSSSPLSDRQADADGGIDIDDDDMSSGDAVTDWGISYEDKEKREVIQYEQGFLSEIRSQISDSDRKTTLEDAVQQKKRRRVSSSESD